jgi:hypothetical protein
MRVIFISGETFLCEVEPMENIPLPWGHFNFAVKGTY